MPPTFSSLNRTAFQGEPRIGMSIYKSSAETEFYLMHITLTLILLRLLMT